MELYDDIIQNTYKVMALYQPQQYAYIASHCWPTTKSGEMVMRRDAAFELGAEPFDSVNYTCITSDSKLVSENQIFVYGQELDTIHSDTSFARIVFLNVEEIEGQEEIYRFIRDLEYTKYHIFPEGYMVRTSAKSNQEQARVSKSAMKKGLSFEQLGAAYIQKYLTNPRVKSVRVMFLTDLDCMKELIQMAEKTETITSALTKILKGMPMNCSTCDLKLICDEVEGVRKLHKKKI